MRIKTKINSNKPNLQNHLTALKFQSEPDRVQQRGTRGGQYPVSQKIARLPRKRQRGAEFKYFEKRLMDLKQGVSSSDIVYKYIYIVM
jgi:hypothetical protein